MKRTIVYIDGYNLYYGLLKGTPWKWLDLVAFSKALLRPDHEIAVVKYFTARAKPFPYDQASVERQNTYLQLLSHQAGVEVVEGFYNKNVKFAPAVGESCRACPEARNGMVRVMKLEEKGSDVNLATAMLLDAFRDSADAYVLVSGDADFIRPITTIRREFHKPVLVYDPHDRRSELARHANYYKVIPRDLPAHCQLPDVIPVGTHGRVIRRPAAWSAPSA